MTTEITPKAPVTITLQVPANAQVSVSLPEDDAEKKKKLEATAPSKQLLTETRPLP